MARVSRPIVYTLVLGAVAYAVVILTEPETPRRTTRPKTTASASTPVTERGSLVQPEDFKAKFDPIAAAPQNVFRPLVARAGASNPLESVRLDGIPAAFAGGDANWRYTGSAEIDGVQVALLENATSGEGVFLRAGEQWKQLIVTSIEDEAVVVVGPGGATRRIRLGEVPPPEEGAAPTGPAPAGQGGPGGGRGTAPGGQVAPLQVPGMRGPIGSAGMGNFNAGISGMEVVPEGQGRTARRERGN